jgi:tetratricopeptide (TPR) repeat protein
MSALVRALQLRELHRFEEAVALLVEHLAKDPEDADAHHHLASTRMEMPGERRAALESIEAAVGLEPDDASHHALRSFILVQLNRDKDALVAAEEAVRIDPDLEMAWVAKCAALSARNNWPEAEMAARQALELNPDNEIADNQLSMCLRMQDRLEESNEGVGRRLERDPEDSFAHANAGWAALQRFEQDQAEVHFREALRLDPEMEYARLGLRESYKARSAFYRLYLRWVFFMQKHMEGKQFLIIIGIYVAFKFGHTILKQVHPLAAGALLAAYLLFAFWGWLASGIGHFLILKDPLARLSLNRREKLDGLAVGGGFFGGLLLIILGATVLPLPVAIFGGALMAGAIPASMVFVNDSMRGRLVFGGLACLVYAAGASVMIEELSGGAVLAGWGARLLPLGFLAAIGSTWLGMVPGLRRGSEE